MILIFFNSCFNIAQIDDDLIASEIHKSVLKNCVKLNEFPNDGKNNNPCEGEIVDSNECPIDETEVIEEYEDIHSIENEFETLLVNVFLVKKKLSFSIKIMQIEMVLQFEKAIQRKKNWKNRKT